MIVVVATALPRRWRGVRCGLAEAGTGASAGSGLGSSGSEVLKESLGPWMWVEPVPEALVMVPEAQRARSVDLLMAQ